jgi:hypothetical protein
VEVAVEDVTLAPDWTAPINSPTNRVWCAVALSVGYVALYLAFDRLSIIEAQ